MSAPSAAPVFDATTVRAFLNRVLPTPKMGSFINVHWFEDGSSGPRGRAFESLDAAIKHIEWLYSRPNVKDVYVCMSSQAESGDAKVHANGFVTRWAKRSKGGAVELKSLFSDVDVKPTSYATTAEAIKALGDFLAASKLPKPTLVVYTGGGGFHVHWVLDRALTPAEWAPLANALKNATEQHGFKTDAMVTADTARILRVPGTVNHKYPTKPLATLRVASGSDIPVDLMRDRLKPYMMRSTSGMGNIPPGVTAPGLNDELGGGIGADFQWRFEDFRSAVEHLQDQDPNPFELGSYEGFTELMFACVWIEVMHPEDADKVHALYDEVVSNGNRNPADTKGRYDKALKETVARKANGDKLIGVGTIFDKARKAKWVQPPQPQPGTPASDLPRGYTRDANGRIWGSKTDKSGLSENFMLFPYPITNGLLLENPGTLIFNTVVSNRPRTISLGFTEAVKKDAMINALSGQGVVVKNNTAQTAGDFFVAWITHLQNMKQVCDVAAFGWTGDGFAYDGLVHGPNGATRARPAMTKLAQSYAPCGDLQVWKDAATSVMAIKVMELDVIIAASFAAPLIAFTGYEGALVSAFSPESGVGKTTALSVAAAIWGHPKDAKMGMNDTANSTEARLGQLRNLPVFWDELQSEDQTQKFIELVFRLSAGREKARMTQSVELRDTGSWETLMMICSNDSLVESVTASRNIADSSIYRCFEYRVPPALASAVNADPLIHQKVAALKTNFGQAGLVYAAYLGSNKAALHAAVENLQAGLKQRLSATSDERFWIATMAVLLVGASAANKAGLTQFDLPAMARFLTGEFTRMRASDKLQVKATNRGSSANEILSQFLNEARARHTLFTNTIFFANGRPPAGAVTITQSDQNLEALHVQRGGSLIRISGNAMCQWLKRTRKSEQATYRIFEEQLGMRKIPLGRLGVGTVYSTGQMAVLEFDLNDPKMAGFTI